jgi:LuxR family maltose regulon positive regulatory protein
MHLVIASHTEPPLPLPRLLVANDLTNITASGLRFTLEEAAEFLGGVTGLDLSSEYIAALEERTEGWRAGLQLAALSMREREDISAQVSTFSGTNRHIFDYLAEEVLDDQDEVTRAFLLRTSILDRLSGPLCEAVTGLGHGQTTLENLERMNLLMVPLDDQRRWYRYQHLFAGFLRERLRRENPAVVSRLHQKAGEWHESNGTTPEAVGHALAAGDFERAGVMIEGLRDSMTTRGEVPALVRMVKSLAQEVLRSRPNLCNMYAIAVLMPAGRLDAAEAWLRDAEQMLSVNGEESAGTRAGRPARAIEVEKENLAMVVGARAMVAKGRGDIQGSISLHRRALELYPGKKHVSIRGIAAVNLAECLLDIGDLAAARSAIAEAGEIVRAANSPSIIAWSLCLLGQLQTIQGHLSEAMEAYNRVLRLADEVGDARELMETGAGEDRRFAARA